MLINFLPFDFLIHYVFSLPKRIVFPHDRLPTLRVPPLKVFFYFFKKRKASCLKIKASPHNRGE